MGKIKVSKGTDTLEIDGADLPFAIKDGYKPSQKLIVANSKTGEKYEVEADDVEAALNEGFSFQDIAQQKDILQLAKEREKLKGQQVSGRGYGYGGAPVAEDVRKEYQQKLLDVDTQIKEQGFDPAFADDLVSLPQGEGFSARESIPRLKEMRDTNPFRYNRELSAIKSKGTLYKAIRDKSDIKTANELIQGLQGMEKANYQLGTKDAIGLVRKYIDDSEEQQKVINDIVRDKSYDYGVQPFQQDERFAHLNPYQQRALNFLKDVDQGTYGAYERIMSENPDTQWLGSKEDAIRRGFETKGKELENIGMSLEMKGYEERLTDLQNKGELTPQEQQEQQQLITKYQELAKDKETQNQRYPNVAAMDADKLMQESMGASNSVAKKFALGVGENFDDAINWVGDALQDRSVMGDLELLGDKELSGVMRYTPEKDKLIGSEIIAKFDDQLQSEIDQIKNSQLSEDEKRDQIKKVILDNQDKVSYIPNDRSGKANFTAKAIFNTVGEVGSEIVSQMAIAALSGGAGNASKLKQLSGLFGSTFATAYNDYYADAIRQDIANPTQYAITHTAIEAASELINNDFEVVKKMVGKTGALGKVLSNVTQEEWEKIAKKGFFSKLKDATVQAGEKSLKNAIQETTEETAGQLASNIADQKLFNKEVGIGEGLGDTMVQTMVGMLPLGMLSLPFNFRNINRQQKYAMYEAGMNPDKFKQSIQQAQAEGTITPAEAAVRIENIDRAAQAVQSSQALRTDGQPMTDNEKTEYAFNQAVLQEIKEQKKNAPTEVKEQLEETEEKLNKEQAELLKPKKQKESPDQKLVKKAIKEGDIKGIGKASLEEALKNPDELQQMFKEIAEQAQDPLSAQQTIEAFGEKVVNRAKELYPQTQTTIPDAETIRSDQGQVQEGGLVRQGGQDQSGQDLQSSPVNAPINAEIEQQAQEEVTVDTLEQELQQMRAATEQKEQEPRTVSAFFAGGKVTGEVIDELPDGRITIQDKKGLKYNIRPKDILKEGETPYEHYEKTRRLPKLGSLKGNVQGSRSAKSGGEKILRDGGNVYHTLLRLSNTHPEYKPLINSIISKADRKSLAIKTSLFKPDKAPSQALYDFVSDRIIFEGDYQSDPQTILHETVHALTALKIPSSIGDIRVNGRKYYERLVSFAREKKGDVIADIIKLYLESIEAAGLSRKLFSENGMANSYKLFNASLEARENGENYGFLNLHEFLAQSFADKEFQDKLKALKKGSETIWDKFIALIVKIVGVKQKDVVEKIIEKGTELMSRHPVVSYKFRDRIPKIGSTATNQTIPENEDISKYTPEYILEKAREFYEGDPLINRVADFLQPIIDANPNIRIDTNAEVPSGVLGYSYGDGRIELNFNQIKDYDTLYRTALHEMVHAATRSEIKNNTAFQEDLQKVLSEVRQAMKLPDNGAVISAFVARGIIDENKYGASNEYELLAEVFTNQKFYEALKDMEYKGDNMLHRLFLAIAKWFSKQYKTLKGAKESINADNLADYLMALTESIITAPQTTQGEGALPLIRPSERDTLIRIINRYQGRISDADLRDKLKQIAGLTDTEIDELMQEAATSSGYSLSQHLLPASEIKEVPDAPKEKGVVRRLYEKYFTSSKGLPKWMLTLKDQASGGVHLEIRQALQLVNKARNTAKKIGFNDWDLFDKALREQYYGSDLSSLQALPIELQPIAVEMRNKIDALGRDLIINNYVTPEQALNIEANMGEYVTRSYRAFNEKNWGKKVPKEVRQEAFRFLAQEFFPEAPRPLTYEEQVKWAEEQAELELNRIIAGISDKYTPDKTSQIKGANLGILQQRKNIPKEIRDLLGEYTDPGVNFAMTIGRISSMKSSMEFMTKVKELGMGNIFWEADNRPPEASVQIAADSNKAWDPLAGLYTTPEVKEVFKEADDKQHPLLRLWMRIVGTIRWGKTVGSVVTQIKNFESNIGFAVMNGHYRAGKAGESFKFMKDKLFGKEMSDDAIIEKAVRLGIVDQSVGMRELKEMFNTDSLEKVILKTSLDQKSAIKRLGRGVGNVIGYLNKIYGTSDDFWKIYGFLNEAESLSNARYNKSYKDLTPEEQSDIDIEASERTKNIYPTYDRVWEGAKILSKGFPIFGNFLSFQAESLRVLRNTISYAYNDLKDPATRKMGAQRLAGIAAYLSIRTTVLYAIAQLTGVGMAGLLGIGNDDDEEQKLKDINSYGPTFIRSGDKFAIDKGDGKYTVYDVGSLEPYGTFFKTINALTEGSEGVEDPGFFAAMDQLLGPYIELEMTVGTLLQLHNNETEWGSEIYNPLDPEGNQVLDKIGFVLKKMRPSTIDFIERIASKEDKGNEVAAAFGGRGYEIDAAKGFSFKLRAASDLFEANRNALNKIKFSQTASDEEKQDAEKLFEERNNKIIGLLSKDYEAAIRLGVNPETLDEALARKKFFQGYTKDVKQKIKTGIIGEEQEEPGTTNW